MSQTKHDLTTTPLLVAASAANPVLVAVVAGDVVYHYSTSAVASGTKDGTIDHAGTSGPSSVVLTSNKWIASATSSSITEGPTTVSVDPLQRSDGQPWLVTPKIPHELCAATSKAAVDNVNELYCGRFTVAAPVTVSTGLVPVHTAGAGAELFCVSIYTADAGAQTATLVATTGEFSFDTDPATAITFTLTAPITLQPGVVYYSGFSSADSTAQVLRPNTQGLVAANPNGSPNAPYIFKVAASHPAPATVTMVVSESAVSVLFNVA